MSDLRGYALVAVLGGALATGSAFAQDQKAGGGRRGGEARAGIGGRGGAGRALRGVNLTDAQQQQIRALTAQHREQNRAWSERLQAAVEAQRKAADANPVDEQAIRLAAQNLAEAQAEAMIAQAKLRSAVFALLTPEQRAQAEQARAERGERGGRRAIRP
jgi:Spy/CpxP family protein refolding chaperone